MSAVGFVALACGLIVGLGAVGACLGIAMMGGVIADCRFHVGCSSSFQPKSLW